MRVPCFFGHSGEYRFAFFVCYFKHAWLVRAYHRALFKFRLVPRIAPRDLPVFKRPARIVLHRFLLLQLHIRDVKAHGIAQIGQSLGAVQRKHELQPRDAVTGQRRHLHTALVPYPVLKVHRVKAFPVILVRDRFFAFVIKLQPQVRPAYALAAGQHPEIKAVELAPVLPAKLYAHRDHAQVAAVAVFQVSERPSACG